jgi:hypothetical protein
VFLVNDIYTWIDRVLFAGCVLLRAWAVIDCAFRKSAAFTAVNKLTKLSWLAITVISGVLGSIFLPNSPLNVLSLASVVVALVYLTDVRPAVREISGGNR